MPKKVKWQVNGVKLYPTTVGSNVKPFYGMASFDVLQVMEVTEGAGDYAPTGPHVYVVLPTDDMANALAEPTTNDFVQYMKEVLDWMLNPMGSISPNTSEKRQGDAQVIMDEFNAKVDTFGGYPIRFSLPGDEN